MCGICGYVHLDKSKRPSEDILRGMAAVLSKRGPDDEGYFIKGNVALGHKRLSIIDLEHGHQPMFSEDGSVALVYNGEVYNFRELKKELSSRGRRFRTGSDTEVIISAYEEYGADCLKLFNGMFALALYDEKADTLILARDRYGKKPLYYAFFDNQFIFGSELKALARHPALRKEIDPDSLAKYLAYEYVPSPHTIFKNIYKLKAGSMLTLKNGNAKTVRYWEPECREKAAIGFGEAKKKLLDLLRESVRKRLISDVPLGVFLSGGIDSSAVVCMMAELMDAGKIRTFTIGFEEGRYDESGDARLVARHFGTDHSEEILNPKAMLDVFPGIVDLLDEPFADSSIIPTFLVSRFTRRHVKVALGGDGGDELFFGYPSYGAHIINAWLDRVPSFLKSAVTVTLNKAASGLRDEKSRFFYAKRFLRALPYPEAVRHQVWIGSFTPDEEKGLFLDGSRMDLDPMKVYAPTVSAFEGARYADPLARAMLVYINTYMTDDILTKVDRASMANSLEVRAPFLDPDLSQFAASLPSSYKMKGLSGKWILKEALKGKLPEKILSKPKHGFAVPVQKWLKEDLKDLFLAAFDRKKIEREGIFNYPYLKGMIDAYMADKGSHRKEFWALFMFEMWYDRWMK